MLLNELDCFRLLYCATLVTCPSLKFYLFVNACDDAIIDEDSALLHGQKASEGERERVGIKGVTNQALHNVLHPFFFSVFGITVRVESYLVCVMTTSATHSTTMTGKKVYL